MVYQFNFQKSKNNGQIDKIYTFLLIMVTKYLKKTFSDFLSQAQNGKSKSFPQLHRPALGIQVDPKGKL